MKDHRESIPKEIPLVTTTQAAALMGVSARTFWRIIDDKYLQPAGVIGTSNVFFKADILKVRRELYGS